MCAYYAVWAVPRWVQMVAAPLSVAGTSPTAAVAGVVAFGAVYVLHTFAQVTPAAPPSYEACQIPSK